MKLILEPTDRIVHVNGGRARIWEGRTESGIPCHALIVRVGVEQVFNTEQFDRELQECRPPSVEITQLYAAGARLIL